MGRIVKSAAVWGDYVVAIPVVTPTPHGEPLNVEAFGFDDIFARDDAGIAEFPTDRAPELPAVDLEAVRRDAEAIVDRASSDAEALIQDARRRALLLIEEARSSASIIEAQARDRGHAEGLEAGDAAGRAQLSESIASIDELVTTARTERHAFMRGAEAEIVRLAMVIAERVIHQQVAMDSSVVVDNVRQALTRLVAREVVTLRVNPTDLETIRRHRDAIVSSSDVENLRIVEDQRVDRGGVVIETEAGTIDAKISTQIREARKIVGIEEPIAMAPSAGDDVLLASPQAS